VKERAVLKICSLFFCILETLSNCMYSENDFVHFSLMFIFFIYRRLWRTRICGWSCLRLLRIRRWSRRTRSSCYRTS